MSLWYAGQWVFRSRTLDFATRTALMGVVNVTPDSFSDGGRFFNAQTAIDHARRLADEGADLLDIGGESTRPGSEGVSAQEELDRVLPVIEALAGSVGAPISIDTNKAVVARAALAAGAEIVNDISGGTFDPAMLETVAAFPDAKLVLMHTRGAPRTMQKDVQYHDVVSEVREWLAARVAAAEAAGIDRARIAVDPGIGFGKLLEHNVALHRRLDALRGLAGPVLLGPSRKSFLGLLLNGAGPDERLEGTLAACAFGVLRGADILRVHDVREAHRVRLVIDALAGRAPLPGA